LLIRRNAGLSAAMQARHADILPFLPRDYFPLIQFPHTVNQGGSKRNQ